MTYLKKAVILLVACMVQLPYSGAQAQLQFSLNADGTPTAGHLLFGVLPQDRQDMFMRAVFDSMKLEKPNDAVSVSGDRTLVSRWDKDAVQVYAQVVRAVLRFRKDEREGKDFDEVDSYDVGVEFLPDKVEVRHSFQSHSIQKEGTVVKVGSTQLRSFVTAATTSSVALVVPEMDAGPTESRGVFICPRKEFEVGERKTSKQATFLIDSGYRLNRGMFSVKAWSKGGLPLGAKNGYVKASISVSPTIPRSIDFEEENKGPSSKVSLEYKPLVQEQLMEKGADRSVEGGIQAVFESVGDDGAMRKTTVRDVVRVKEVFVGRERSWQIQTAPKYWKSVSPGPCYIVLKDTYVEQEFGTLASSSASSSVAAQPGGVEIAPVAGN